MKHYDRRARSFAICLSVVAGYVDAVGFLALGGFFVSFMSGNSTRLSVGLATHSTDALVAGGLIVAFVLGVMAGAFAGAVARTRRPVAVLALVALLLALAAGLALAGLRAAALGAVAMAMGAENAVFEREGEVSIGLTYMTGTLVKFGQGVTAALLGGDRLGWLPYLALWAGLASGAVGGALCYPRLGLGALWIAAAAVAALAALAVKLQPDAPSSAQTAKA